jgi:hypothetical protein
MRDPTTSSQIERTTGNRLWMLAVTNEYKRE